MSSVSEIKFTCEACGQSFPADPDTMVEYFIGGPDDMTEAKAAALREMDEEDLRVNHLTREQVNRLLAGEPVAVGAICLCKKCQDAGEEE